MVLYTSESYNPIHVRLSLKTNMLGDFKYSGRLLEHQFGYGVVLKIEGECSCGLWGAVARAVVRAPAVKQESLIPGDYQG